MAEKIKILAKDEGIKTLTFRTSLVGGIEKSYYHFVSQKTVNGKSE